MQWRRRGHSVGGGGSLSRFRFALALTFCLTATLFAAPPFRMCIYGENWGAGKAHRALLKQAKSIHPRLYVICGDALKHEYGKFGSPEAVLADYRNVFGTAENRLTLWPSVPGPQLFAVPGGNDEQYFLDPELAAQADSVRGGRTAYEGTSELGTQLYEALNLDQMRIRVQPLPEIAKPLPMSAYGDYLLLVGQGSRRECALLMLYRTDRWGFLSDQIDWVDSTLKAFRKESPTLPLLAMAQDWTWFFPDTLDDGARDGVHHSVREGAPQSDAQQKHRLAHLMKEYRVDLAIAAGRMKYWSDTEGALLRMNCGAAICSSPRGKKLDVDNLWLEYSQSDSLLRVNVHPVEFPAGNGIRAEAAAMGLAFEKKRAAGSVWRKSNP